MKEQCSKIQQQQKQLSKDLTNIQKKIRTLQSNTTSLDVKLHQNMSSTKNDIGDIKNRSKETIKLVRTRIRNTNQDISSIKSDILRLNTDIKNEMKQRQDNEQGLDCIIENILKVKCGIYPQVFHGGEMNGVCCKRLLQNIPNILGFIKELASERLQHQIDANVNRATLTELTTFFQQFKNLFMTLDHTYSLLRIPGPNEEDINDIRSSLKVLEKLWREIKFGITPKAHVMFVHTLQQSIEFDIIADKVEDYVKKAHQIGKKLVYFTSHLNTKEHLHKQNIQIKHMLLQYFSLSAA